MCNYAMDDTRDDIIEHEPAARMLQPTGRSNCDCGAFRLPRRGGSISNAAVSVAVMVKPLSSPRVFAQVESRAP
jgi:hypothetical protein